MAIRCASKAIIVRDGCVLLNRCRHMDGSVYYDLPGGGQHQYESMEQAVIREVMEETGHEVRILRLAAIGEEIHTDVRLREKYPDYSHRVMHIFLAEIVGSQKAAPSEKDWGMEESEWVPLDEVEALPEIHPSAIRSRMKEIVHGCAPVLLETDWVHDGQE